MKKIAMLSIIIIVVNLFIFRHNLSNSAENFFNKSRLPKTVYSSQKTTEPAPSDKIIALPKEFNLNVPFTSQAPFGDWSLPYEEACEEASAMMVDGFYKNHILTPGAAKKEIDKMVDWQMRNFKEHKDLEAKEMAEFIKGYYGYSQVKILANPSLEDIKKEIFDGHPIIAPAAGRLLGNRFFHQPGPLYHMLVLRGWTKDGMMITNDPGTKNGENYLYKLSVLLNALHKWNGGDVLNGKKYIIVIENNI